jgi:integrase
MTLLGIRTRIKKLVSYSKGDAMAHIQKIKLKRGVAHQVYYIVDGVRRTKYFPASIPMQEVKRFSIEMDASANNTQLKLILKKVTLAELSDIYAKGRSSEVNPWRVAISIKSLIKCLGADFQITSIDHHKIHSYRDWLLSSRVESIDVENYAAMHRVRRGVNKELCFLRVVFRWAYKNDLITTPVFDKVTMLKSSVPIPDVLSKEEDRAFYKAIRSLGDRTLRLAYWILKYTGLCRSELVSLTWKDIDIDEGYIKLTHTKNMDEAIIPIHLKLLRVIRWIKREKASDKVILYKKDRLTRNFRRAMTMAGLKKKSPMHILRHSLGARIIEHDLSDNGERVAQEMLRHKTRSMTRYYTRIAKKKLKGKLSDIDF